MRLAALSLLVPDYDAAISFFCDGLGFSLTEDIPQGTKRWVTVSPPGQSLRLVLARADTSAQRAAIGQQAGGRVWLFLHTDDFVRDAAKITAAGGVFEEDARHEVYGTVAVWRDPFGNRWDLIQPKSQPKA
jgi:catechol 2,3-dioxygenase-like lactoylglutathione lyase family enzyme